MNSKLPREISAAEIDTYHRDGVVLLESIFDSRWIDVLTQGLAKNCDNPTHRARTWDRDAQGRTMFWDSQAWQNVDEYKQFIFCLLYTSPSPRDRTRSRMPSSA